MRMWHDEQGVALPIVLGIATVLFFLLTVALIHIQRQGHVEDAEWKIVRAQYTAESGIAHMQGKLCSSSSPPTPLRLQLNGFVVDTQVVNQKENAVYTVQSIGRGRGVQQTIYATIDSKTCRIIAWHQ